jgi:uncharacterized membrane protein
MAKRSLSYTQRAWLLEELDTWRTQALVSTEQAQDILTLYETSDEVSERQHSRTLVTLMGVAAFLIGLAALLLIGYNWAALPRAVKLLIIFGAILGAHTTGFLLRYRHQTGLLSEIPFFLGCLLYGAGIWLVAQIFHLNAHYPDGMWWWAVGVLPFALSMDTVLLHTLFVSLLALWASMEILHFNHLGLWFFGRWSSLPNGAYSLPLLALPGLMWAYRKASLAAVSLYVPLLAGWVIIQPFAWEFDTIPLFLIGTVGALFLIVSESHPAGSAFAIPYREYGVLLSAGALVPLSYYEAHTELARHTTRSANSYEIIIMLVLSTLTIIVLARVHQWRTSEPAAVTNSLRSLLVQYWFPSTLVLLMLLLSLWRILVGSDKDEITAALLPTVLANVTMLVYALWLTRLGLREDRGRPFAAGVAYFLLWAIMRYIDLFGDFGGMLGASLMFFLCGAVLFGVAFYWRRRKEVRYA